MTKGRLLGIVYAVMAASLITANLSAIKNESLLGLTLGGGIITIVVDYIVSDMTAEVFGLRKALQARRCAMLCNVLSVIALQAVVMLPSDPGFAIQPEFAAIFTAAPRMVLASMVAYMAGTAVNDRLMQRWHERDGEGGLFKRCILSTVFGGAVDTAVFTLIAYFPDYSIASNMENILLTYVLKLLVEVVVFHVATRWLIGWAKTLSD